MDTTFDTDDETDPQPIPAESSLFYDQPHVGEQSSNIKQSYRLPLCMYDKVNNLKTLLNQVGPDIVLVSETWERQRQSLDELLQSSHYKTITTQAD